MKRSFCCGLSSTPLRPPPALRCRGRCAEKRASASCWQPLANGSAKAQNAAISNPVNARIWRSSSIVFTSSIPKNTIWEQVYSLNVLVSDLFALYLKTKNYHWHMNGQHFRDYHLLLDEQSTQIYKTTDPVAERSRKTGLRHDSLHP